MEHGVITFTVQTPVSPGVLSACDSARILSDGTGRPAKAIPELPVTSDTSADTTINSLEIATPQDLGVSADTTINSLEIATPQDLGVSADTTINSLEIATPQDLGVGAETTMASPRIGKKPRPLSIIKENSGDDLEEEQLSQTVKVSQLRSRSLGQSSVPNPTRRLAVAPLEHPIVSLNREHLLNEPRSLEMKLEFKDTEKVNVGLANNETPSNNSTCIARLSGDERLGAPAKTFGELNESEPDLHSHKCNCQATNAGDTRCFRPLGSGRHSAAAIHVNDQVKQGISEGEKCSTHGSKVKFSRAQTGPGQEQLTHIHAGAQSRNLRQSQSENSTSDGKRHIFTSTSFTEDNRISLTDSSSLRSEQSSATKCPSNLCQNEEIFVISECTNSDQKEAEKVLDSEQVAWIDKVRECIPLNGVTDNFRPLRRSLSSIDSRGFRQTSDIHRRSSATETPAGQGDIDHSPVENVHSDTEMESRWADGIKVKYWPISRQETRQPKHSWHADHTSHQYVISQQQNASPRQLHGASLSQSKESHLSVSSDQNSCGKTGSTYKQNETSPGISAMPTSVQTSASQTDCQLTSQRHQTPIRRISAIDQSDFRLLKATTSALNLPTRRPSTLAWRAKYMNNQLPGQSHSLSHNTENVTHCADHRDSPLTRARMENINHSLAWLRQELIDIRIQDQSLARQLLGIRHSMNKLRLVVECEGHKELLDSAEEDMEELRELSRLVDIPTELYFSPTASLQHIGVTRMNLTSRRFSTS